MAAKISNQADILNTGSCPSDVVKLQSPVAWNTRHDVRCSASLKGSRSMSLGTVSATSASQRLLLLDTLGFLSHKLPYYTVLCPGHGSMLLAGLTL